MYSHQRKMMRMIMISREDISEGDIIDAFVYFEDNPSIGKKRPVLVISPEEMFVLSLKMTSHPPRQVYQGEYPVMRWKEAGLSKPTTVRASKVLRIRYDDIICVRGRLDEADMIHIRALLRQLYGAAY